MFPAYKAEHTHSSVVTCSVDLARCMIPNGVEVGLACAQFVARQVDKGPRFFWSSGAHGEKLDKGHDVRDIIIADGST